MLSAEQNDRLTHTGPGTPAGRLMRCYWQPAALVDELSGQRPVKPVRLLGESPGQPAAGAVQADLECRDGASGHAGGGRVV